MLTTKAFDETDPMIYVLPKRTKSKWNTQTSTRKSISSNARTAYWQYKQSIHKSKNTGCNIFVSSARTYSHALFLISPYTHIDEWACSLFLAIQPNSNEFQCATGRANSLSLADCFALLFLRYRLCCCLIQFNYSFYSICNTFTYFICKHCSFATYLHSSVRHARQSIAIGLKNATFTIFLILCFAGENLSGSCSERTIGHQSCFFSSISKKKKKWVKDSEFRHSDSISLQISFPLEACNLLLKTRNFT